MKKLLLLSLVMSIGLIGYSQSRPVIKKELQKKFANTDRKIASEPVFPTENFTPVAAPYKSVELLGTETVIAETKYDLQSNNLIGNRIWAWEDGTVAAVITRGLLDPSFADRGTGYNYFDGNAWGAMPTQRIETVRTGFPSIAAWGTAGEINVAHNATGLTINKRDAKGTGSWTESSYAGPGAPVAPTWPRMITSGENNEVIHMFYNTYVAYEGQPTALLYSRSIDGGATWDPKDVILDGLGADYYTEIDADAYVLAARGNTIAMLSGNATTDLFIMKSVDNGENWEKIMIWEHPYPFWNDNTITTDTLRTMDNSADIAIDVNGMCHVVFGITRILHEAVGAGYSYFFFTDGIGYWNEGMGQIPEADDPHYTMSAEHLEELGMLVGWVPDLNGNGEIDLFDDGAGFVANGRQHGLSTMPSISIDENGVVLIVYVTVQEDANNTITNYRRIWGRTLKNFGTIWGGLFNLTDDFIHIFDECLWPVVAKNSPNNQFHVVYQADQYPGTYLWEDHDPVINSFYHSAINKDDLVGIKNPANNSLNGISVSQNSPNPANAATNIVVEINAEMQVSLQVCNITGQKVMEIPAQNMIAGKHSLSIDASTFAPGVYFYTVTAGSESITNKMIVK